MNLRSFLIIRKPSVPPGNALDATDLCWVSSHDFPDQGLLRTPYVSRLLACCFLVAIIPGCTLCQNIKRSVLSEPTKFSATADRWRSVRTYREWADEAYGRFCPCGQAAPFSCSYEIGFKDGFVDYVYGGGSGEPPPVPPREFWDVRSRTNDGKACAADWFDGYRHGASVARDEGYRDRALVATSRLLACPIDTCQPHVPIIQELGSPLVNPATPNDTMPQDIEVESVPIGPIDPSLENSKVQELTPEDLSPPSQPLEPLLTEPTEVPVVPTPGEVQDGSLPPVTEDVLTEPLPTEPLPVESVEPPPRESPEPIQDLDDLFGPQDSPRSTSLEQPTQQRVPSHGKSLSRQEAVHAFTSALKRKHEASVALATDHSSIGNVRQTSANLTPAAFRQTPSED